MRSFFQGTNFYKCNLHCHTDVSDGALSPAAVKEAYRARGYHAVAFADHEVLVGHADLCDGDFIALHGYETAVKQTPFQHTGNHQRVYHLCLYALRQDNLTQPYLFPGNLTPGNCAQYADRVSYLESFDYECTPDGVSELVRRAKQAGFFVSLNHPMWSLTPEALYTRIEGLDAVEICNTASFPFGDNTAIPYDALLRSGKRLIPVGGDDNHNRRRFRDSFGAFTMLAADELTYEALTAALARGDAYTSTGPTFTDIGMDGDTLYVHCSPVDAIILHSEGRYLREKRGDGLTEARFPLDPEKTGGYVRIELIGGAGHAFSRAYYTDEWRP